MIDFEKWFKTTEAYKMLEEQNYFKMDLFFFVGARNQYRHSGVQVAYLTWQHQQAIIDEHTEVIKLQDADLRKYEKQIESLKAQINNMEACYIEKKKQVEGLHDRIDGALFEMRQLSLILSKDIDGYEDPAQICQSEGVDMGVKILEKALRGAND